MNTYNLVVIEKIIWSISYLSKNVAVRESFSDLLLFLLDKLKSTSEISYQKIFLSAIVEIIITDYYYDIFIENGGIEECISILNQSDIETTKLCLLILLLFASEKDSYREKIVSDGILIPLVYVLEYGKDMDILNLSLQLLTNLTYTTQNEIPIMESGILLSVVDLLESDDDSVKFKCVMLLANLAINASVRESIIHFGWDINIANHLKNSNPELKRQYLRFMLNVSANDVCRKLLLDTGVIDLIQGADSNDREIIELSAKVLMNLKVPIPKEVEQSLVVEIIEVEIDENMEKSENGEGRSRSHTMTMVKNVKDAPLYLRREKIAKELYQTEESYVKSLSILINTFYKPLVNNIQEGKTILTYEEMETIFSVTPLLYGLHTKFLKKLSGKMSEWTWNSTIGDLFVDLYKALNVYKTFVNNYDRAIGYCTNTALKKKAFVNFLKECEKTVPEIQYAGLAHFLIQPVQRIPRYVLLLEQMYKYTPETHIDHGRVRVAIEKLKEFANYLNEAKRSVELNNKTLQAISKITPNSSITFKDKTYELIGEDGRVFIKDGTILQQSMKQHKKDKEIKPSKKEKKGDSRHVNIHLFNDLMIISSVPKGFMHSKVKILNVIHVNEVESVEPMENDILFRFGVTTLNGTYVFIASNASEKEDWLNAFSSIKQIIETKKIENETMKELDLIVNLFS